jgi:hypothetical protein
LSIWQDPDAPVKVVVKLVTMPVTASVKVPVMVVTPVAALKTAWRFVTDPAIPVRVAVPPEVFGAAPAVSGVAMNMASSAKAIPAVNRRSFMGFLPTFPAIFDPPRAGVVKIGRRCCAKGGKLL